MITPADDYPLHQTSRPLRDPGTDRNLYDRFFFCGYPTTGADVGQSYFALAFGQYVGRNVCDGAFSIIHKGTQYSVRGSRLLGDDRLDLKVGPVRIEIIEPMRTLRVHINDETLRGELTFTARGPGFEEPHYRWAPGNLTIFDITRMTQNGTWSGYIEVGTTSDHDRIDVTNTWMGTRDRSWGIRPVGRPEPNPAPDGPTPTFYWLWAPLNFPDMNVLFDVNENSDGTRWHENAAVAPTSPTATSQYGRHTYDIRWKPGTRVADQFAIQMDLPNGPVSIALEPLTTFYMQGIGYTHPTWGHGFFIGPDERTADHRTLGDVDPTDLANHHVQHVCRATRDDAKGDAKGGGQDNEVVGYGILEILARGPHDPSGFTSYTDVFSS